MASQRSTARNASQSVATTKLLRDDRPQITKLQPCNFSFTKHSVTSLRGRVLLSQSRQRPMFGLTSCCTHASWYQPLQKPPDEAKLQPCNFSSTEEHSSTRLRGRVLVSRITESQCRGLILTYRCPKDHTRDFVSTAVCISYSARDFMHKTCWSESNNDKAFCQRLVDWLTKSLSMQQDITIYARLVHICKKTPRKMLDMTEDTTFASLAHSLLLFRISMLNLERKPALEAIQNDCSFIKFITVSDLQLVRRFNLNLNPRIGHRTIVAQQSVHSKLIRKSCTTSIEASAKSSHQICIFHSNENYLAAMSTANAHFIRAHGFVVDENHTTINERFSSCYDECICAGSRHMMQDQLNALSGHFVPILSAWLFLYLAPNMNSGEDTTKGSLHVTSRLIPTPRLQASSIIIKGSRIFTRKESRLSHQRSISSCDDKLSLGYFWSTISSALASEGVHSELITANLTSTASYQDKLHATHWYYLSWNKQIASKFTELRLIGLMKFSRFQGSVTKQQIFYI